MANRNMPIPSNRTKPRMMFLACSAFWPRVATRSPTAIAATDAAPAATVIGTRKRRQCSQAAPAAMAPDMEATIPA